jgi:hypothetical protein
MSRRPKVKTGPKMLMKFFRNFEKQFCAGRHTTKSAFSIFRGQVLNPIKMATAAVVATAAGV